MSSPDLGAYCRDLKAFQFMRFHKRDHRRSIPGGDQIEVSRQTTVPETRKSAFLLFAWSESYADKAAIRAGRNFSDSKRMTLTGLDGHIFGIVRMGHMGNSFK